MNENELLKVGRKFLLVTGVFLLLTLIAVVCMFVPMSAPKCSFEQFVSLEQWLVTTVIGGYVLGNVVDKFKK